MAGGIGIQLSYKITNAEVADSAPDDKYLIVTDPNTCKKYNIPRSLSVKMKKIYIGEEDKTV